MKNIYSYLVALPIILFSLVPSINWRIDMPGKDIWIWYILIAGFFGFYTLFLKTNIFIKIIAIGSFLNCFFSSAPYFSFTAYISVIFSCYFYILCTKVKNWKIVFNVLKTILLLNVLFISIQLLGYDNLLNFGVKGAIPTGTIGQTMQMGSLSIVLSSMLILVNPLFLIFPAIVSFICTSTWTLLTVAVGILIYMCNLKIKNPHKRLMFYDTKKLAFVIFTVFVIIFAVWSYQAGKFGNLGDNGRLGIWIKSVQLSNVHPIMGYGIGTYQYLFTPLADIKTIPWKTAHNFLVQILFETGYTGLLFVLSLLSCLFYKLIKTKNILCLAGLSMLVVDGLVHFPDRMIQTVVIIIAFLAYCTNKIKEKEYGRA